MGLLWEKTVQFIFSVLNEVTHPKKLEAFKVLMSGILKTFSNLCTVLKSIRFVFLEF